jgi:superfamily II DNA or RNA helicase
MQPQRNEPCHCGSGIKYKKCCLIKDLTAKKITPALSAAVFPQRLKQDTLGTSLSFDPLEIFHYWTGHKNMPGPERVKEFIENPEGCKLTLLDDGLAIEFAKPNARPFYTIIIHYDQDSVFGMSFDEQIGNTDIWRSFFIHLLHPAYENSFDWSLGKNIAHLRQQLYLMAGMPSTALRWTGVVVPTPWKRPENVAEDATAKRPAHDNVDEFWYLMSNGDLIARDDWRLKCDTFGTFFANKKRRAFVRQKSFYRDFYHVKEPITVIKSAFSLAKGDPELNVYIAPNYEKKLDLPIYTLKSFESIPLKKVNICAGPGHSIRLQHKLFPMLNQSNEHHFWNPSTKSLIFADLFKFCADRGIHRLPPVDSNSDSIDISFFNFESFKFALENLNSRGHPVLMDKIPVISPNDLEIQIHMERLDSEGFHLKLAHKTDAKGLLHKILQSIATCLKGGVEAYSFGAPYLPYKDSETWHMESSIHKDEGFKHILFSEILTQPLLSASSAKANKKTPDETALNIVKESFRKKGLLQPDFVQHSQNVREPYLRLLASLVTHVADCFVNGSPPVIANVNDGVVQCQVKQCALKLLQRLLPFFVDFLGKDFFKRSRMQVMRDIAYSNSTYNPCLRFYFKNPSLVLSSAFSHGFKVFIGGKDIAEIAAQDLKTELVMTEKGLDWFELNPQVFFKGKLLSDEETLSLKAGGLVMFQGQLYYIDKRRIPSVRWLNFFWDRIQGQADQKASKTREKNYYKNEPSQILNLIALKLAGMDIIGGAEWQRIAKRFDEILDQNSEAESRIKQEIEATQIPLKEFQKTGTKWMLDLCDIGLGGILADDMGLGKTIQSIAFLAVLLNRKALGQCLVVLPPTLLFNWQAEIKKFAPHLPLKVITRKEEICCIDTLDEHDIVLCSYGILSEHVHRFKDTPWNIMLFDEAQNLKNLTAKRTSAARFLNAKHKFCLTGTPLENHYGEFYSLIDLCVPGSLGSYKEFCSQYGSNIKDNVHATEINAIEFLRLKTRPLLMRRTKLAIQDELPDKSESVLTLDFDEQQKRIYRNAALTYNKEVGALLSSKGESKSQIAMLTALLRLRQICSQPNQIQGTKYTKVPPKFSALLDNLSELSANNESVVVFTTFKQTLLKLAQHLGEAGLETLVLTGDTPLKERQRIVEEFDKSEKAYILLMTQKVGGVGLNLTRSSYVFHVEPWWNPQVENQATDRVYRIGQKRAVQVYRYIMRDSVEERIQLLKKSKSLIFDRLFSSVEDSAISECDTGASTSRLSRQDFEFLIAEHQ